MKKRFFVAFAGCALAMTTALAQAQPAQPAQPGPPASRNGGVLELPQGIEALVSIDAHNFLIMQARDKDNPGQSTYAVVAPQHIYSGAIARIFGGAIVPTAQFLVPGGAMGSAMNGGPQSGGVLSVNSNNPFGSSFSNGNLSNGNFSNNGYGR